MPKKFRVSRDMTTNEAPFIEEAKSKGDIFIEQPYSEYSAENHQTWQRLYARQQQQWQRYAIGKFLDGVGKLCFDADRVPRLEEVNKFLKPLTGFKARAVSGYIPAYLFFDCLRQRAFPTTVTIRGGRSLDYLPEPDIFHDIAGHVPMHTDRRFADTLVRFGEAARQAAVQVQSIKDHELKIETADSVIRALARFFWFTIEFGLMKASPKSKGLKVYGSGLLSSYGEIEHAIDSERVQRFPFQLEWVINQHFKIDRYQPILFVVDSFDHLFDQVGILINWMKDGRLDNVAPAEARSSQADLESFLQANVV